MWIGPISVVIVLDVPCSKYQDYKITNLHYTKVKDKKQIKTKREDLERPGFNLRSIIMTNNLFPN